MITQIDKMAESFVDVDGAILVSESLTSTTEVRDEIETDTMVGALPAPRIAFVREHTN